MKTALVNTTIQTPRILNLLRTYSDEVGFFVAGDHKSPDAEIFQWMQYIENTVWLSAQAQQDLNYECSNIIGWNTTSRRNIALLEAIKWGAEIIIYWDSDNLPLADEYFWMFQKRLNLAFPFNGLQVINSNGWHNQYGSVKHRGFPPQVTPTVNVFHPIIDANIGAVAGLCLGDPDIDAYTRMALAPTVQNVCETHRAGYVVNRNNHCVFNSQNTAFLRQFAPAMFLAPGIGRADDIFASLLTQRCMRDRGYHVYIGPPFTYQERNPHDLLVDLRNELFCMENVLEISEFIDRMPAEDTVIGQVRAYYGGCAILPEQTRAAGLAFLEDIEKVL